MNAIAQSAKHLNTLLCGGAYILLGNQIVNPCQICRIEELIKDRSYKYYLSDGTSITVDEKSDTSGVSPFYREGLVVAMRDNPLVAPDLGTYRYARWSFSAPNANYVQITEAALLTGGGGAVRPVATGGTLGAGTLSLGYAYQGSSKPADWWTAMTNANNQNFGALVWDTNIYTVMPKQFVVDYGALITPTQFNLQFYTGFTGERYTSVKLEVSSNGVDWFQKYLGDPGSQNLTAAFPAV